MNAACRQFRPFASATGLPGLHTHRASAPSWNSPNRDEICKMLFEGASRAGFRPLRPEISAKEPAAIATSATICRWCRQNHPGLSVDRNPTPRRLGPLLEGNRDPMVAPNLPTQTRGDPAVEQLRERSEADPSRSQGETSIRRRHGTAMARRNDFRQGRRHRGDRCSRRRK